MQKVYLWACSAGYGLIPADAPDSPLRCDVRNGHADSVPGDAVARMVACPERVGGPSAR